MSKSGVDIWYALMLPARRWTSASGTSVANARVGSTGRCVPAGRCAVCIAFSADPTTAQASSMRTIRASRLPLPS